MYADFTKLFVTLTLQKIFGPSIGCMLLGITVMLTCAFGYLLYHSSAYWNGIYTYHISSKRDSMLFKTFGMSIFLEICSLILIK
jgi:hypothetical protein